MISLILPRKKEDLLENELCSHLDQESKEFIGRYIEQYIEEITFFIKSNQLEWVIKDHGGIAYVITERTTPIKNDIVNPTKTEIPNFEENVRVY